MILLKDGVSWETSEDHLHIKTISQNFCMRSGKLKGLGHEIEFNYLDKNNYCVVLGLNKNLYWFLKMLLWWDVVIAIPHAV